MNEQHEKSPEQVSIDSTRRRLTKAGLAAPAVLGVLASRPVLGANPYHMCTPSGHISGFASANNQANCKALGQAPSYYASSKANWPGSNGGPFLLANGNPRPFNTAPNGLTPLFANAYEVRKINNNQFVRNATVWDVLKGFPVQDNNGNAENANKLVVKSGFTDDASFTLGKEAIAACMSAVVDYPAGFPISPQAVARMFNNVVATNGVDQVTSTATWNAAEVIEYFRSLYT
jgi:hypothetical protein